MKEYLNRALALMLVLSMLIIGGMTLISSARSLGYAFLVTYTQYLEPDSGIFGNVKARIRSLNNAINIALFGKDQFEKANARVQLALGKQVLSFGGSTMVTLRTGQLYDVQSDVSVSDLAHDINTMARLKEKLEARGVPMVYLYAHTELYEDDLVPAGIMDYNIAVADRIVNGLREAGIQTIDSRQVYKDKGLTMDNAVYRTDQHWSILSAFTMYGEALRALNATGALHMDEAVANMDNFDMRVLKNIHMGAVGARVGASVVEPDDFQLITPKFETSIHQSISAATAAGGGFTEYDGSFEQAVMHMEKLEGDKPANRYDTYGYHNELTYFTNESAPEGRLLILKDSFGTPVSSFFSLAVRDICALDLRKGRLTAEEIIDQFNPDAVLVVYCQEMMRGKNYVFVE